MSKIKDFFDYIYKEFYNSDFTYLITTSIYLVVCTLVTIASTLDNTASFSLGYSIAGFVLAWCAFTICLFPVFMLIVSVYTTIDALITRIKYRLKR